MENKKKDWSCGHVPQKSQNSLSFGIGSASHADNAMRATPQFDPMAIQRSRPKPSTGASQVAWNAKQQPKSRKDTAPKALDFSKTANADEKPTVASRQ